MYGLTKVANEQLTFKERFAQEKRKIYAKQYNLNPETITDEQVEQIQKDEQKKSLERMGGAYAVGGGALLGHKAYRDGSLTGRRTFYHNTDKENVDSIKQHGLQASRAADGDNWTHKALGSAIAMGNVNEGDLANKVYLANKPSTAFGVGVATQESAWNPDLMDSIKDAWANRKNVKVQMPLDEVEKLNIVENPELRGAKSGAEFHQKLKEFADEYNSHPAVWRKMEAPSAFDSKMAFRGLGKNTTVVEGDIPSQFIKGGEGFQSLKAGELLSHIKNRPGTFAKGVGIGAAGLGLAGAGGALMHDGFKKLDYQEKEASEYIVSGLAKVAFDGDQYNYYNQISKDPKMQELADAETAAFLKKHELQNQLHREHSQSGTNGSLKGLGIGGLAGAAAGAIGAGTLTKFHPGSMAGGAFLGAMPGGIAGQIIGRQVGLSKYENNKNNPLFKKIHQANLDLGDAENRSLDYMERLDAQRG